MLSLLIIPFPEKKSDLNVFALEVSNKAVIYIMKDLNKIRKDDGVIHFFTVCRYCLNKSKVIGRDTPDLFFFLD